MGAMGLCLPVFSTRDGWWAYGGQGGTDGKLSLASCRVRWILSWGAFNHSSPVPVLLRSVAESTESCCIIVCANKNRKDHVERRRSQETRRAAEGRTGLRRATPAGRNEDDLRKIIMCANWQWRFIILCCCLPLEAAVARTFYADRHAVAVLVQNTGKAGKKDTHERGTREMEVIVKVVAIVWHLLHDA